MEFWEIAKLGNHQELNDLKLKVMQVRQKQPPLDDLPYSAELRIFSFLVSKVVCLVVLFCFVLFCFVLFCFVLFLKKSFWVVGIFFFEN